MNINLNNRRFVFSLFGILFLATLIVEADFHVGLTKAVKAKVKDLEASRYTYWPQHHDDPALFTASISDATGDFEIASEGPPSVIPFPPIDVTRVLLGVSGDYLYFRLEFDGIIPRAKPQISGQTVQSHFADLGFDMDRNAATGASIGSIGGVDLILGTSIDYGREYIGFPNASFDFANNNADEARETRYGEYRSGGPGTNFIVARFAISQFDPALFPHGDSVKVGGWSEAKSVDYHHFAFDTVPTIDWTLP